MNKNEEVFMKGKVNNMIETRNILHRLRMGHTKRGINKELGIHRSTIRGLEKLAIIHGWLDKELPMPSDEEIAKFWDKKSNPRLHPLDFYKDEIERWNKEGLTSIVIHQLLKDKCLCDVQVIRRYRNKHFPKPTIPVMVRSTVPGRDMDVDFGDLGKFIDDDGVEKKAYLFSLRLRHSRKVYREITTDQMLSTFLMGHVHAFEYFNGVPKNCITDNLKAAVIRSTIDNDMINRSYQELAEHYGFIISPCLPRKPEHKGGVEGDMKYTKRNFLPCFLAKQKERGISKPTISDLKEALEKWDKEFADVHIIHGVGRSPIELFKSEEEQSLQPLQKDRWEPTCWSQFTVRKEWRVTINNAHYSVPYHLIGETVEVCVTHSSVRIFHKNKEVALHEKAVKNREYKRKSEHAPPFQEAVLMCSREGLLTLAGDIGTSTRQSAHNILSHRSIDKLKPVRYMLRLADKYSKERLEKACERALNYKMDSYRSVKNILENNLDSQPFDATRESKIISLPRPRFARDPADYKSNYDVKESFEDKLQKIHPVSKNGNAMLGTFNGLIADQIMKEELFERKND